MKKLLSTTITLAAEYILNLLFVWPGQIGPDSIRQLQQAVAGLYTDHHPPIMAMVWRQMLLVFPYTSGMLLLHLTLLYAACLIFMLALGGTARWWYVVYPIFPPIFFYSFMIWKDVGFAFSFLFVSAAITYYAAKKIKPTVGQLAGLTLVLFYGTAVKFQAVYSAPFMIFGLVYCARDFTVRLRTILESVALSALMIISVTQFNSHFSQPSDSWKFVKIYDLAGMSVIAQKPLFPEYILNSESFSFKDMQERFNYERVDDIVFFKDSPISRVETKQNRAELLRYWKQAIWQNPSAYLRHRYNNWVRIVFAKPLEKLHTLDFTQFETIKWFSTLQKYPLLGKCIFFALNIIRHIFSFFFVFILMILYCILGCANYRNRLGIVMLAMNGAALALVCSLYFLSMASQLRYVYAAVCLLHASHPIAYRVWRKT